MNLKEIRQEAWDIARETGVTNEDKYWTATEMNRYINRVQRKIARETRCIKDSYTSSVCNITVAPPADLAALELQAETDQFAAQDLEMYNDPDSWLYQRLVAPRLFAYHPSIIEILEVKWKNNPWRLLKVSVEKWRKNPFWERVCGMSTEFCTDYVSGYLSLNYRMTTSDTLQLCVTRLPIVTLKNDSDIPEVREQYHEFFINGILEHMYSKQDVETFDMKKASDYKKAFEEDLEEIKKQESFIDQRLKAVEPMEAFK